MAIGLSTYAFFWRASSRVSKPLSIEAMLEQCAELGAGVFQICDHPAVETLSSQRLEKLRLRAEELDVELELGTRGIGRAPLDRYLDLAEPLGVSLLRSMLYSADHRPTTLEAQKLLSEAVPRFEARGVRLALETYEQVPSAVLVELVERIDSPFLGICLDPGNCVAALERPVDVIDACAARVFNLHVKDFAFSRRDGWVGFTFAGCPLGEGLLDYAYLHQRIRPQIRGINQIVEHWLPWQTDEATTCRLEAEWTRHCLDYLKTYPSVAH